MNNSHEKKARRIATLLAGYMRDNLTPAEHDELDEWVGASDKNMRLFEELTDERRVQLALEILNDNNQSGLVKKLKEDKDFKYPNHRPYRWVRRIGIAASIAIALGVGSYFVYPAIFGKSKSSGELANAGKSKHLNATPAIQTASLILDNDEIITLGNVDNGIIANQESGDVIKKNGEISYKINPNNQNSDLRNKLTTPKGGYYTVTLPDGTVVKLNVNSSISYPLFFLGKERRVSLTGEGYFEVASSKIKGSPNEGKPFFVDVNDRKMSVKVLGTHFNVSAYTEDDLVKTTLVEGKVTIFTNGNSDSVTLDPGQQAALADDGKIAVNKVEDKYATYWMKKFLWIDQKDLTSSLNVISRWYDVDLEFASGAQNTNLTSSYSGSINLDSKLEDILKVFNNTTPQAHFELKGRKLIVNVKPS